MTMTKHRQDHKDQTSCLQFSIKHKQNQVSNVGADNAT